MQKRYQLDEEWQKGYVLHEMGALWRASKSRLVQKLLNAKNEEERMRLRPDNIKSISEWKCFVKEKTSDKFKVSALLCDNIRISLYFTGIKYLIHCFR